MKNLLKLSALVAALALGASAHATNLVTNGDFESSTNGAGQLGYNTDATGWTTSGYNFLFASGTADTTGSVGQYGSLTLWGPGNGSANGLPASSPTGGNYVGADGAFIVGAISQNITGLTAGKDYTVNFYWAGAQQNGFTGATTENWTVSLGGESKTTATVNDVSHGFTGWQKQSFTFKADGASDMLSFLAHGTPNGEPPFSLLDGVSLNAAVPEPATWAMMIMGVAGVGALARRRRATVMAVA